MPNSNENPDDANSPSERRRISEDTGASDNGAPEPSDREIADFDCPESAPIEAFDGNAEAPLPGPWFTEYPAASVAEADAQIRAELDGQTADGLSAIFREGTFRFVTPCHVASEGLRASKICGACKGNLDKPVETAIPLTCGHFCAVDFANGDRLVPCPTCGAPSIVNAEQVITTRYLAREPSKTEQMRFLGLQA